MGVKPGPVPKPTALRLLHNDRVGAINTQEPKPAPGLPTCPDEAADDVRAIWDFTVEQLDKMSCVATIDRDMLYVFCNAVALHRFMSDVVTSKRQLLVKLALRAELPANGDQWDELQLQTIDVERSLGTAIRLQRSASETVRQYGAHFGLSPSSRSGIKVGDKAGDGTGAERYLSA